jgi:hypothetical protein
MKIRIMGLPTEIEEAITTLTQAEALDVIEVSDRYPNRGNSRLVRVYIEAQLSDSQHRVSEQRSYAAIQDTWAER